EAHHRLVIAFTVKLPAGHVEVVVLRTKDQALRLVQAAGVMGNKLIDKGTRRLVIAQHTVPVIIPDEQVTTAWALPIFQRLDLQSHRGFTLNVSTATGTLQRTQHDSC